jgi:predicted nucleic acid binding AN1-type Zn finger protein
MLKCDHCKKKIHLRFDCKWCKISFCSSCLAVEKHDCIKIGEMKATKHEELKTVLLNNKTFRDKLEFRI